MKNKLPFCNTGFIFQTKCKISNFSCILRQNSIILAFWDCFQCGGCNATYYGKTKGHFKVRMCERFLPLSRKRVKCNDSAIKKHLLFCNHQPDFEDFSILTTHNNDFKVSFMKRFLINRDHPLLNKNKQSLPWTFYIAKEQRFVM